MLFNGKEEKEGRNKGTLKPLLLSAARLCCDDHYRCMRSPHNLLSPTCAQIQKRAWSNNVHLSEVLKGVFFVDSVLRFTFKWFFFSISTCMILFDLIGLG